MDLSSFASADLYRRNAFRAGGVAVDAAEPWVCAWVLRDPVRRLVDGWFHRWPEGVSQVHDAAVDRHVAALEGAYGDDRIEAVWGEVYAAWDAVFADEACWVWAAEWLGDGGAVQAFREALPGLLTQVHADLVFAWFREDQPRALLQYDALRRHRPEVAERALLAVAGRRLDVDGDAGDLARAVHWLDRAEDLPLSAGALGAVEADARRLMAVLVERACADAERRAARDPQAGLGVYRELAEAVFDPMRRIERFCPEQGRVVALGFARAAIAMLTGHGYAVGDAAAARRELEALRFEDEGLRGEIREVVESLGAAAVVSWSPARVGDAPGVDRGCAGCARVASGRRRVPIVRDRGRARLEEDAVEVPVCSRCAVGPLHARRFDVAVVVFGGLIVSLGAYASVSSAFAQVWGGFAGLGVLFALAVAGRVVRVRRLARLARSPYLAGPWAQGWRVAP